MSVKSVIDWINLNGKPLWWRHAVRITIEHGSISDKHKEVLYELAKTEFGIIPLDQLFQINTLPVSDSGFTVENAPVRLVAISNVSNIASLVENKNLNFDPSSNLSVVYGNNGSGKSSYAKILKNVCLTRGSAPVIISNVYKLPRGLPSTEISIKVGSQPVKKENWIKGSPPSSELKSIRVFDSNSANHYLSKEDNIEYKPAALKILDELIEACNYVETQCTKDIKSLGIKAVFPILPSDSEVKKFLNVVSKDTTHEQLERNCANHSEIDGLDQLRKDLLELQANSPKDLKKKYRELHQRLEPLIEHFDDLNSMLNNDAISIVSNLYNSLKINEVAAETSRKLVLDGLPVDGVASSAWVKMWEHVETFIATNGQGNSFPPIEGEYCPTCIQPITQSAADHLKSFNIYLKDKTHTELRAAKKSLETSTKKLKRLNFELAAHDGVLKWIESYKVEFAQNLIKLNSDLLSRHNAIVRDVPAFTFPELDVTGLEWLKKQNMGFKQKEIDVKDDASKSLAVFKLKQTILDIEHRSKVTENKISIQNEILRLKQLHLFNNLNTSRKIAPVTIKVKVIAEEGSVGKLQEEFLQELRRLNFNNLSVETFTRGKDGQSTLQLKLSKNSTKITEIASEGEQKCIALAGFLAELTVDNRKSAVVFDDPVNSLDHLWRDKFANRIVEESKVRQVIVLTHDLTFMKLLEDKANVQQVMIDVCAIRRHGDESGFPMESPPWEVLSTAKRIGKLKNQLPVLKKMYNNPNPEYFTKSTKEHYREMRITWERLVEEWLFIGVVERFNLDIRTQKLRYIDTIDASDNKIISESMKKCSDLMHYNASGFGVSFPDYNEVESDFDSLDTYFQALKRRRT
jgi:energy-coupling factor transporter ATP-binding protein EcfA2